MITVPVDADETVPVQRSTKEIGERSYENIFNEATLRQAESRSGTLILS